MHTTQRKPSGFKKTIATLPPFPSPSLHTCTLITIHCICGFQLSLQLCYTSSFTFLIQSNRSFKPSEQWSHQLTPRLRHQKRQLLNKSWTVRYVSPLIRMISRWFSLLLIIFLIYSSRSFISWHISLTCYRNQYRYPEYKGRLPRTCEFSVSREWLWRRSAFDTLS